MSLRRALVSISAIRGFFAPASSSTSRTLPASCSTSAATALMPTIHWFSLLMIRNCSFVGLLAGVEKHKHSVASSSSSPALPSSLPSSSSSPPPCLPPPSPPCLLSFSPPFSPFPPPFPPFPPLLFLFPHFLL